jgi:FMN-dependent NADH-azoreductase
VLLSDELIRELELANELVIGVPMHNFSVPGTLKLWIDQVARPGKTFSYAGGAPAGLLKKKISHPDPFFRRSLRNWLATWGDGLR